MTRADSGEDEAGFRRLTAKIAREKKFACGSYKDRCLRRRIAVRMRACKTPSYATYTAFLDQHPAEWEKLLDALTINVTKLFRNPDVYDAIADVVVPELWNRTGPTVRVWSAGCSSGEETYSIAILFHRHAVAAREQSRLGRVHVLGSDIDKRSLLAAERGAYRTPAFGDTRDDLRKAYFSASDPAEVNAAIRAITRFERRDLLNDPPPNGPFQLVVCRNVMIYFDRPSQDQLMERFHSVLSPGGFLVLGKTETLFGAPRDRFTIVKQRERIYRRV
ncbi:MAG TPA: protein-glutamate O-methyltransferase CheR [Gemmatimonadaceae bacterium]|nr:protein-glutamate O-methyltransferase CheR [Gemmatimonadaceae bacterium]